MKSFLTNIVLFAVFCGGLQVMGGNVAKAESDANDPNRIISSEAAEKGDSNNSSNSVELLDVIDVEGPNAPDGYISGDAFNLQLTDLLKNYVDQRGFVNYAKLRRFRLELNTMAEKFANIKPEVYITWSRDEKIAFWINTYNICTLKGIVDNYPIKPSRFMLLFYPANSVMHIKGLREEMYFMVMGIQYTLEEIERDILLGRFEEPRACFAISYGTIGSAPLRAEPYIGKVLDKQLEDQVKNYLNYQGTIRIDEAEKIVYLSPIFKMYNWREEAFIKRYGTNKLFRTHGELDRASLNFVKDYISDANAEFLKRKEYTVEYTKYNWLLNEQKTE